MSMITSTYYSRPVQSEEALKPLVILELGKDMPFKDTFYGEKMLFKTENNHGSILLCNYLPISLQASDSHILLL